MYLFTIKITVLSHVIISVIATACTGVISWTPLDGVSFPLSVTASLLSVLRKVPSQEMFINYDQVS